MMDREALAYHRHMRKVSREAKAMIGQSDLEYFSRQAQGGCLNASEQQAVVREVAQLQRELEESRKMHADLQRVIAERAQETFKRRCHRCHVLLADGEMCLCRM